MTAERAKLEMHSLGYQMTLQASLKSTIINSKQSYFLHQDVVVAAVVPLVLLAGSYMLTASVGDHTYFISKVWDIYIVSDYQNVS